MKRLISHILILIIISAMLLSAACGSGNTQSSNEMTVTVSPTTVGSSETSGVASTTAPSPESQTATTTAASEVSTTPLEMEADFTPVLKAEVLVEGLDHPWDLAQLPDGSLIFTERAGRVSLLKDGQLQLLAEIDDVVARGEGGLTGLALDSDYPNAPYLYLAYNYNADGSDAVKVMRYTLTESFELSEPFELVGGIPANSRGRHSGTQLETGSDGALWIGTGDAANSDNPQNPQSLAGKILRVSRSGEPWPGNLSAPFDPRIFSYGHRNTQGLALLDITVDGNFGFSAEHGSNVDDEINPLLPGNFGWDPIAPYNESVPMTDKEKFPEAVDALWSSGERTIAISGISLLRGLQWGTYENMLAVSVLKDRQLRIIGVASEDAGFSEILFEGEFGRLRAAVLGQDGNLYLSTDNGGNDMLIRVTPVQE